MGRPRRITDESLLDAAREVFVREGFGASTRAIAKEAGISEAVIFQRHKTKADLFFAAMVPPPLDVDALLRAGTDATDLGEHVENMMMGMVAYCRKLMPVLLPLVTHPSFDFEAFAEQHPDTPLNRLRDGLVEFFEALGERGAIRPDYARTAGLTLLSTAQGLALFERLGVHGGRIDDTMIRHLARSIWVGFAPE